MERIACWSARHRKAVVGCWLLFLGVAFVTGQLLGGQSRPQYDPGQAGQAERVLHQLGVVTPPAESVLIQARGAGQRFAADPEMRRAAGRSWPRWSGCRGRPGTSPRRSARAARAWSRPTGAAPWSRSAWPGRMPAPTPPWPPTWPRWPPSRPGTRRAGGRGGRGQHGRGRERADRAPTSAGRR